MRGRRVETMASSLLGQRWIHNLVLSALAATIILLPDGSVPRQEIIYAVFVVGAWMLGVSYERNLVIDAGLATASEIADAERAARGFINWGE